MTPGLWWTLAMSAACLLFSAFALGVALAPHLNASCHP